CAGVAAAQMRETQTKIVSVRARARVCRGKSARKVSSRKPPGDETSRALDRDAAEALARVARLVQKRADANTHLRSATSRTHGKQTGRWGEGETGRCEDRAQKMSRVLRPPPRHPVSPSPCPSSLSGATPVEAVARGEREAEAQDDEG